MIEYNKSEFFCFSRAIKNYNLSFLDLSPLSRPLLIPKDTWCYFGFFLIENICFYTNKSISIIKCMKMPRNLTRELSSDQKQLLYKTCVLPIALYGFYQEIKKNTKKNSLMNYKYISYLTFLGS